MKGASPATAKELVRRELPQLVPRHVPVPLRDVPHGAERLSETHVDSAERPGPAARASCATSPPTCGATSRSRRSSSSRSTSTTRSARRSSRRSASCRGTASRARRGASSRGTRARWSSRSRTRSRLVELGCGSGEKLAMLAERLRSRRRRVLVHLIDISPAALELSERTLGALEHVSVVGHRATYEEGLRHAASQSARRRDDARALPRLEHRQLRPARPPTSSSRRSAAASGPATRSCSAPTS